MTAWPRRTWKEELVIERIRELKGVPFIIDGVHCYGGGVDEETAAAIRAFEEGDLEEAERWCVEAEGRSLRRYDADFEPTPHGAYHV